MHTLPLLSKAILPAASLTGSEGPPREHGPSASRPVDPHAPGQGIVELALILPVFMLIILGVVDLGRAFYESIAIQGAAEAGSLFASKYERNTVGPCIGVADSCLRDKIKAATNPDVFPFLQIQDLDITIDSLSTTPWGPDSKYKITVTRNFKLLTPLLGNVFGSQNLTLRAVVYGQRTCSSAAC